MDVLYHLTIRAKTSDYCIKLIFSNYCLNFLPKWVISTFKDILWEFITIIAQEVLKLWRKQIKREKISRERAKKQAKGSFKKEEDKTIPIDQVITLDHLTNPDKK